MRKLFILMTIMVTSFVLVACTGTNTNLTPPSFTGVRVENLNPVDGDGFVTFYKAKQNIIIISHRATS